MTDDANTPADSVVKSGESGPVYLNVSPSAPPEPNNSSKDNTDATNVPEAEVIPPKDTDTAKPKE